MVLCKTYQIRIFRRFVLHRIISLEKCKNALQSRTDDFTDYLGKSFAKVYLIHKKMKLSAFFCTKCGIFFLEGNLLSCVFYVEYWFSIS